MLRKLFKQPVVLASTIIALALLAFPFAAGLLDANKVANSVNRLLNGQDEEQSRVWSALMLSEWCGATIAINPHR